MSYEPASNTSIIKSLYKRVELPLLYVSVVLTYTWIIVAQIG